MYVCIVKSIDISEGLFCREVKEEKKNSSRNQQWQCG